MATTSCERSKLWVEREKPGIREYVDSIWRKWELDSCPAGLDYFLLYCGAEFGLRQTRDWVILCSKDLPAGAVKELSSEQAMLLIDRIELLWRRRLRSTPGWEAERSARVNKVNRVVKRAKSLAQEAATSHLEESPSVL